MSNKKKYIIKAIVFIVIIFAIFLSISYAFFHKVIESEKSVVINAGVLDLVLEEENEINLVNALPMYDEVGMIQDDVFNFRLINNSEQGVYYNLKLNKISVSNELSLDIVKYYLTKDGVGEAKLVSSIKDNIIDSGIILGNKTIDYSLRLWIDSSVTDDNEINNKSLSFKLNVEMSKADKVVYQESILNGSYPVLSDNLIPVTIASDGTVIKADIEKEWYSYENKEWANAVVLTDTSIEYEDGEIIPEANIESYFVWIPKYSYELWDLGEYSSVTSLDTSKVHSIGIRFGLDDTSDNIDGECTTPGVAGENGNCKVGDYMTHPAFQAFDSTGFWVGKFESGYNGATTTEEAQVNSSDSTKLIIKPNVYSWRNITVGNAFKASYDYLREDESHMMKNTEWGAVAYLQHSIYGSSTSVRVNNNSSYITGYAWVQEPTLGFNSGVSTDGNRVESTTLNKNGTYTKMYNTEIGYLASTTSNITGVYDTSGGALEYVMGYNESASTQGGSSEITSIYDDFFTSTEWEKYYDKYQNTTTTVYTNRILGDATGEMGPFYNVTDPDNSTRPRTSWYGDYAYFLTAANSWFFRGGYWGHGVGAGAFNFSLSTGGVDTSLSFRVVLTP